MLCFAYGFALHGFALLITLLCLAWLPLGGGAWAKSWGPLLMALLMALLSLAYLMGRRLGEISGPIARFFKLESKNPSKQSLVVRG